MQNEVKWPEEIIRCDQCEEPIKGKGYPVAGCPDLRGCTPTHARLAADFRRSEARADLRHYELEN